MRPSSWSRVCPLRRGIPVCRVCLDDQSIVGTCIVSLQACMEQAVYPPHSWLPGSHVCLSSRTTRRGRFPFATALCPCTGRRRLEERTSELVGTGWRNISGAQLSWEHELPYMSVPSS